MRVEYRPDIPPRLWHPTSLCLDGRTAEESTFATYRAESTKYFSFGKIESIDNNFHFTTVLMSLGNQLRPLF